MPSNTDPPARLTTLTATTGLRCPRSRRLARSIREFSLAGAVGPCVRHRSTSPARPYVSCPVDDCDRCRALAGVRNLCLDNLNVGRPDLHCTFGDETSGRVDRRQHAVDVPVSK